MNKKMLEKLFTSKNRVKILEYFFFVSESGRLREISKKSGISVSAVSRELKNLIKIGIIKKIKDKFSLDFECSYIEDLKNIFIKTDACIYLIQNSLNKKKIKFAFIFGSFANGNYKVDSDIDLMVLGDITMSEVYSLIRPVEKKIKRDINPVVWTIKNLEKEKNKGFVKDIFKKKIIMLKGGENEVRRIIKIK